MTSPQDESRDLASAQGTPRTSRWQRFSPSMGWKAFWSEIIIVVLGVAIALAASEAVQEWSWRNKVRDGELRMQDEVGRIFAWSAEQHATQTCVDAQLDRLVGHLTGDAAVLTAAPVFSDPDVSFNPRFVMRLPLRPWRFSVWDALVADGTATHFSAEWQGAYGLIGDAAEALKGYRDESNPLVGRLMAMTYPIALDADVRRGFLVDVETLRRLKVSMLITATHLLNAMSTNGLAPAPEEVDAFLETSGTVKFCKEHGLPLADWRDFGKAASPILAPAPPR